MTAISSSNPPVTGNAPLWRELSLAVVVGLACYALSCLLVAPAATAVSFGEQWQKMSVAPFELPGQFPHRILAPLLAHVLGMGGESFVMFVRGLAVALLATVFVFARRHQAAVLDSCLATLAIAVTAAIQMYKQHWVGFVDPLCYTLFFWMWLSASRPTVFWALFLANLFNHELAAFLLPWAWFVRRRAGGSVRADAIGIAVALSVYAAFYLWVKAHAHEQAYNYVYFAEHPLFPGGTVVVWCLMLVNFVVAYGPILAVIAWHQHRSEHRGERWHLWVVGVGMLAIFCIAFDWARHSNLIILPLVLASVRFLAAGHRLAYVALLVAGVVGMVVVPPWASKSWPTHRIVDPAIVPEIVVVDPAGPAGQVNITFGPLRAVLRVWLPEVAGMLAIILAIGAAIWLAGYLLARRDRATAGRAA